MVHRCICIEQDTKQGPEEIDRRIVIGLTLSLAAHALLLPLAAWKPRASDPVPRALRVRLQSPAPPSPSTAQVPAASHLPPPGPAEPSSQPVPPPPAPITKAPSATRWLESARKIMREQAPPSNPFLAPPVDPAAPAVSGSTSKLPALGKAFTPVHRYSKICGYLVEFEFGIHRISMPVSGPCEDKAAELEMAPRRHQLIDGAPASPP